MATWSFLAQTTELLGSSTFNIRERSHESLLLQGGPEEKTAKVPGASAELHQALRTGLLPLLHVAKPGCSCMQPLPRTAGASQLPQELSWAGPH